ncbi:hypothetical protein Tco_0546159 [Tanacetum coccineum]
MIVTTTMTESWWLWVEAGKNQTHLAGANQTHPAGANQTHPTDANQTHPFVVLAAGGEEGGDEVSAVEGDDGCGRWGRWCGGHGDVVTRMVVRWLRRWGSGEDSGDVGLGWEVGRGW